MSDVTRLLQLASGKVSGVDLTANNLVTLSVSVGGGTYSTLTKAILDNLIALQNGTDFSTGTNSHTHDGRYFTKTQLGSTTGGSAGSTLIGDNASYSNFTPTAATLKGALSGIDTALGTISSTSALDGTFRIKNTSDNTKQLAFDVSAVTTATTRTIKMADADVDLANLTNSNISASASIALSKLASLSSNLVLVSNGSGVISTSSVTTTTLGYLDATSSIQTQLNNKQATGNYITALTGDVTASGPGSVAATIAAGAVTASKLGTVTDGITLDQSGAGSTLEVKAGGISNTQISSTAAIAFSKLAALSSANILVGSAGNVATSVPMSGEATIDNAGAVTLDNSAVINKVLTGYTSGAGTITSADSILSAIQKLNGNAGNFATKALDNLASTAVNVDILPNADITHSLGSASLRWVYGYFQALQDNTDSNSVLIDDRKLTDSTETFALDWQNRHLMDSAGSQTFSWGTAGLLDAHSNRIENITDPTSPQDAATKAYVDNAIVGLEWKQEVQAASTGNVSVSAFSGTTLDGVTLTSGVSRILLKDQTAPEENGIYLFNGSGNALTRTTDANTWAKIDGAIVYTEIGGTANGGTTFVNTNSSGGTLGTTAITFGVFSSSSAISGAGTAGYAAYWTSPSTISAEQYLSPLRGGLGVDASAFTGVVKAASGVFSASSLVNADVSGSAAISFSKLASMSTGQILVGNAGVATATTLGGDATIGATGTLTISAGAVTASKLGTVTDGVTLDQSGAGSTLEVKAGGISNTQINASAAIAYSKLNLTGSIVNGDVNASAAIAYSKLSLTGSIVNADIASAAAIAYSKLDLSNSIVAGDLTANSVTSAKVDTGVFDQTTITGGSGTPASVVASPAVKFTATAGQSFSANTSYAVRWGITANSETANRVYAADITTSSYDLFYVIGMASSGTAVSAGQTITVTVSGSFSLSSSDSAFATTTEGSAVFLDASGAFTLTAPTTPGQAVTRIGIVQARSATVTSNIIFVSPQTVSIN